MRLKSIALLATTVAILASCTKQEFDNNPNAHTPGTLAITELTIDGQGAAPITRATMEGGVTDIYAAEPNTAITAFVQGDEWTVGYSFDPNPINAKRYTATAALSSNGKWTLTPDADAPLRPTANGEKWAGTVMSMRIKAQPATEDFTDDYEMIYQEATGASLGTLTGATTRSYYDALFAISGSHGSSETDAYGNVLKGMIAIDRNTDSPTLGAVRINLTHAGALMHLAPDAIKIDGKVPTDAKTLKGLWAKVSYTGVEFYAPFTPVAVSGTTYWQAITPAFAYVQGFVTLVGDKDDATTDETIITTLDGNGKELAQNKRYPLAMNVTTTVEAEITFTTPGGLPGWGTNDGEIDLIDLSKHFKITAGSGNNIHSYTVHSHQGLTAIAAWMNGSNAPAPGSSNNTSVSQANRMKTNITLSRDITLPPVAEGGTNNWAMIVINYTGTFDGGGFTISGLAGTTGTTNNSTGCSGLFYILDPGGVIKNLTLADVNITGTSNASALVVDNYGTITNCHVASGTVVTTGNDASGIAISNNNLGTITACSNRAAISSDQGAGGITSNNSGTITACSNHGAITGSNSGGIVGHNPSGTITACWNIGGAIGTGFVGSIVGSNIATIAACWGKDPLSSNYGSTTITPETNFTLLNAKVRDMNTALTTANVNWQWTAGTPADSKLPTLSPKQ